MLSDERILQLIRDGVIEGADESAVGPVTYDLVTRTFYDSDGDHETVVLNPGDSTFVSCREIIDLPDDLTASVHLKNSRMRQGLSLDAPIYFPGHKTRVFFRVTNVSASRISLDNIKGIAQISFDEVSGNVSHPYRGAFSDELDYSGMGCYKDVYQEEISEIERKTNDLKGMEKRIYERTIALFAIFAAVFTLVNVNANAAAGAEIIAIDLSIVGGFSALVGLIGFVLDAKGWAVKAAPLVLAGACFIAAALV